MAEGRLMLDGVAELMGRSIGLDPASLGPAIMLRAIERRVRACGLPAPEGYLARLRSSPAERQALVEELVVGETWFYRDLHPFRLLQRIATTWAASATPGAVFRALSIPCSSGEEPYSIAIALLDAGLTDAQIEVRAFDVSHVALTRARRAIYAPRALRVVPEHLREAYFERVPEGFRVVDRVRKLVRLEQGNLVDPAFLAAGPSFQVVFCRNLIIYLADSARRIAYAHIDRLLEPEGVFFVGHAEKPDCPSPRFELVDGPGAFGYRRSQAPPPPAPAPPVAAKRATRPAPKAHTPRVAPKQAPASRPQAPSRTAPADPQAVLKEAESLANQKRFDEALERCERVLRQSGPSPRVYHLLGVIHHAAGRLDQAEHNLGRAVYLDPSDADALLILASIAQRRGDSAAADRFRVRARRTLGGSASS